MQMYTDVGGSILKRTSRIWSELETSWSKIRIKQDQVIYCYHTSFTSLGKYSNLQMLINEIVILLTTGSEMAFLGLRSIFC